MKPHTEALDKSVVMHCFTNQTDRVVVVLEDMDRDACARTCAEDDGCSAILHDPRSSSCRLLGDFVSSDRVYCTKKLFHIPPENADMLYRFSNIQ
jgi:hypothetical protein